MNNMIYDLILGFRSKPSNLTEVLEDLGFRVDQTTPSGLTKLLSKLGLELEPNLVAKATFIGRDGKNDYELETQKKVMEFLRNNYNGVIYDPKERTEVKEIRLDPLGCIRSRPKAYGVYHK